MSRLNMFLLFLVFVAVVAPPLAAADLDTAIKRTGKLYFGTALDRRHLADPLCESIAHAEFGCITTENSLKWGKTQRMRGNFTVDEAEQVVGWAHGRGKTVRGHALVWHVGLP